MDSECLLKTLEQFMPSKELLSALAGALIGGAFTMLATSRAHALAAQKQRLEDESLIYDTTRLIHLEISTAVKVFNEEYGEELLQLNEDTPYVTVFPIGENTFPIFDSAPACLSRLPHDLSSLIVRLYMRAKGLISMIELNNADSEQALQYARETHKKRLTQINGMITDEVRAQLVELYRQDTEQHAVLLGMGGVADGMKGLAREITELLGQLDLRINSLQVPDK